MAKLHIMLLDTPSHNKRQTFTSIHSIAKSAENATDFSILPPIFMTLCYPMYTLLYSEILKLLYNRVGGGD